MATPIPDGHPLRNLFCTLTERSFVEKLGWPDVNITEYVSNLLVDFTHTDNLYRIRNQREQRLDTVVKQTSRLPFGGTDCALPMVEALKHRWEIDVFVIYTDSETWAGRVHPVQALRKYREKMGIPAKLVVVGMASNGFSIADPEDAGMLDVVGFDTATPGLIADFGK